MYEIQKNIEIPEKIANRKSQGTKYPFMKMNVGDSFWIDQTHKKGPAHTNCMFAARGCKRRTGRAFVAARELGGIRVWRVE